MNVAELIALLGALPPEATVDAMFETGADAFPVTQVDLLTVSHGRKVCVLVITDGPYLKTVA